MRKYFLSAILCVFGMLCITSEPAKAYEISQTDFDVIYTNGNHPYCKWNYSLVGAANTKIWGSYSINNAPTLNSSNVESLNAVACGTANENNMYLHVQPGDVMTLYVRQLQIYSNNYGGLTDYQEAGEITGFSVQGVGDFEIDVVDFEEVGQLVNKGRRVTYWKFTGIVNTNTTNPNWGIKWYRNPSFQYEMIIDVMGLQLYRPKERLDYTDQLDEILAAIDGISTSTGVKEGMEEAMEEEKQQIQDASDESAEAGDDAKDQAENATSTLSDNIATIISAIKDTPKSNCLVSFGTRLNLNNLNMCAAPSNLLTAIRAVVIIPITLAVLRTSYNLIMMFWHLLRKEQE